MAVENRASAAKRKRAATQVVEKARSRTPQCRDDPDRTHRDDGEKQAEAQNIAQYARRSRTARLILFDMDVVVIVAQFSLPA